MKRAVTSLAIVAVALTTSTAVAQTAPKQLDFNRDIRPILSEACFQCHGPDKGKRKADLRLDTQDGLRGDRGGYAAVVPHKPGDSELIARITETDPDLRMPPKDAGRQLTAEQIALLKQWVEEGAEWKGHWAYLPPRRPDVPKVDRAAFVRNEIDRFVLAKLNEVGLNPSPEADRRTLIRRLSFDLTGLPPTPEQVEEFLSDTRPDAYERLVDRVLESPHYGERMAAYWLDLVRYADTGGYHSDNHRDVWLYRDFVIRAFNENLPFDRFTTEQLAGDLLPNATRWQRIASGYNRLIKTTEEGGAQAKEYQAKYDADRVRNVSEVWMGATMGCAECHDHKFDPYTMQDFYSLASFFADIQERSVGRQPQTPMPTPDQAAALERLDREIAPLQKVIDTPTPELARSLAEWEQSFDPKAPQKSGNPPKNVLDILAVPAEKRNEKQRNELAAWHRGHVAPELEPTRRKLAELKKQRDELTSTIPTMLVSTSGNPRTLRILPRGNWLDDSGPVVTPAVPECLPPLEVDGRRATRLDLARWLTAKDHPLTSRVFVNRLWKLGFGRGLVKTLDDFGAQGTLPTHPELLDWLAVDFVENGWDVKRTIKLIVMSGTYRQSSQAGPELRKRDPYNQWYARQGRFRLDAEFVRDNALAVSGLLVPKIGGPSVKPYQPAGYWKHLNFPKREWQADTDEDQYRRGLYTYWQRTFLHPSLLAFDATSREECTVERPRSNTPLQALVLLNDPTYVEASRALAERILREAGSGTEERIQHACRLALSRDPRSEELGLLTDLYGKHLSQYKSDPKAAAELLSVGLRPVAKDLDQAELAAWTSVARVVLNLHETITRY